MLHITAFLSLASLSLQPVDGDALEATASTERGTAEDAPLAEHADEQPASDEQSTSDDAPTAVSIAATKTASSQAEAPPAADPEGDDPGVVIRPKAGHWGMHFTFGGLAGMNIAGLSDVDAGRLTFTELGVRRALDNGWAIPFSAGVGWLRTNPEEGDSQNTPGVSVSVGVRKSFRVWRRIAPYWGADVRVAYVDPGETTVEVGGEDFVIDPDSATTLSLGPNLGMEYFIADRVSLLLQGDLALSFTFSGGNRETELATRINGGGQMGLVFYF